MSAQAIIEGVGETTYSKASGRTEMQLLFEAIMAACDDAGISPVDIDGFVGYPHSVTPEEVMATLGLRQLYFSPSIHMGGASALASVGQAAVAVEAGVARHVLIVRGRNGYSGPRYSGRPSQLPSQGFRRNLEHPYGWQTAAQRYAFIARRYIHEHGLTRDQLGAVALTMREHAQLNPRAQMYGRPLTLDAYRAGRMITDPYTLFDCSLETDGACAVIVGTGAGTTARSQEARVLAVAEARPESPDDLSNRRDLLAIGLDDAARRVWERVGFGPSDIDAAMIYDCFTFELIHQIEAAGFVPVGEGGRFVEAGNIRLGARLPVNTHGGLLSEGHMAGLNHVVEAVRQLRREAGPRQVEGASRIAVTGWGDLGDGSMGIFDGVKGRG